MENVCKRLSCEAVNEMDMVDYLATIGLEPKLIRGNEHWYTSPFRDENTPSFKVDRKLNRWYDHGERKGGKLVDFAVEYYHCTVGELLRKLSSNLNLPVPEKRSANFQPGESNHIVITFVKPLSNFALLQYAESRSIPKEIIQKYCNEVSYNNGGKDYFAIGFKNDLGGYELRSKYFKGSSSPKGFTHLNNGQSQLAVFEGFFNFLSFQKLHQNSKMPETDFLILNSVSFFEKARPIMEGYKQANLFLDGNAAGRKFTNYACSLNPTYQDKSSLYNGHEDLNDFIRDQATKITPALKNKRGLRF
ncbi:CHC2 zinc finger [Mucilaginibacter pineti]|uniref:CHC2 zinc finger n=1 Tax=Mucilaginibacter pineti TaxID=1391627 RepID=A0A1G7GDH9_9SPHI|nr:toprim domain-containing protein [Mucilaginibacter pineti]SDE86141.1 CHC2 zinc finger [Mucilaginibacter pineti]